MQTGGQVERNLATAGGTPKPVMIQPSRPLCQPPEFAPSKSIGRNFGVRRRVLRWGDATARAAGSRAPAKQSSRYEHFVTLDEL